MKVSHEVPLCMMNHSRSFNDFDYALVHLFENYPKYYEFFKDSLLIGREVILDNSVFELGYPFEASVYLKYIEDLKPTYAIIPDKFENFEFTVQQVDKWIKPLKELNVKSIGVLQGKNIDEFVECYKRLNDKVDKIAISFAQPLFERLYPQENKHYGRMYGRTFLINHLLDKNIINKDKKHHLLGISLPQELNFYKSPDYLFLESVDTSSPIVHGIKGISYTEKGLSEKIEIKLVDMFDIPLNKVSEKINIINENIRIFKTFSE